MATVTLRPRTGLELIDASFQFFRENFALLFVTVVAAFIPLAIIQFIAASSAGDVGLALLARVADWVFSSVAQAAAIVIVARRYLGESVTPGDALRAVGDRFGTVLAVSFLYGLAVGVGLILLIVPGIYFATKYFAAMPAAMIEGPGQGRAFERSSTLTEGSRLRIAGVFLVAYFIYIVVIALIGGLTSVAFGNALGTLLATLLMACLYPFIAVLVTLLYFDLRIRREGLDLDLMLDPSAASAPAAG